ncbi:fibulin-7-like [Aplochiton taeniatus]
MKMRCSAVAVLFCLHHIYFATGQECPTNQELQSSLQQIEKMLAAHEATYQQSLRSLRLKLTALQSSTPSRPATSAPRTPRNATCPKLEGLANGKRLGRVFAPGHEVHFLCKAGYELLGPQTRVCLESLKWSGQQPTCRLLHSGSRPPPSSSPSSPAASSSSSLSSPSSSPSPFHPAPSSSSPPLASPTSTPPSAFVRLSRCTQYQGSTHCTCDGGFTISGRDNSVCTDIDECEVFPLSQPGRLCTHACVNTPGSFQCVCPLGYELTRDQRSCKDVDECESSRHNCTQDQLCVNTYGGFQCVQVDCPRLKNATYIKTSAVRCERNPCVVGDKACAQAPNSISHHYLAVVSDMAVPRTLFRVSAARVLGDTLRFALAGARGRGHFSVQRTGRQTGTLVLVAPARGPAQLEAEVEMSELEKGALLGRYLTKVTLFVSPYAF